MTKEEFLKDKKIAVGVRLPYFKAKKPVNRLAETARRAQALGGLTVLAPIYGAWLFMQSQNDATRSTGKSPYRTSEAYNIHRDITHRLISSAKRGTIF